MIKKFLDFDIRLEFMEQETSVNDRVKVLKQTIANIRKIINDQSIQADNEKRKLEEKKIIINEKEKNLFSRKNILSSNFNSYNTLVLSFNSANQLKLQLQSSNNIIKQSLEQLQSEISNKTMEMSSLVLDKSQIHSIENSISELTNTLLSKKARISEASSKSIFSSQNSNVIDENTIVATTKELEKKYDALDERISQLQRILSNPIDDFFYESSIVKELEKDVDVIEKRASKIVIDDASTYYQKLLKEETDFEEALIKRRAILENKSERIKKDISKYDESSFDIELLNPSGIDITNPSLVVSEDVNDTIESLSQKIQDKQIKVAQFEAENDELEAKYSLLRNNYENEWKQKTTHLSILLETLRESESHVLQISELSSSIDSKKDILFDLETRSAQIKRSNQNAIRDQSQAKTFGKELEMLKNSLSIKEQTNSEFIERLNTSKSLLASLEKEISKLESLISEQENKNRLTESTTNSVSQKINSVMTLIKDEERKISELSKRNSSEKRGDDLTSRLFDIVSK